MLRRRYTTMADKMFCSVQALIENHSDELLLVGVDSESAGGLIYSLPGGRIDYGESPEESLEREIEGETGLEAEPESPFDMYHYYRGEDSSGPEVVVTVWETDWEGEVGIDSTHAQEDSISTFGWYSSSEISELNTNPRMRDIALDYLD
jgi:8-oxo-dGTP pyrophosphatase MutT (NUDIX family)